MSAASLRRLSRHAFVILIGIDVLLALSIFRDVGNVTTTRLYLSARADAAAASDASQRFDIDAARVVPQIAIRGDEGIAFHIANPWPSTFRVDVRPAAAWPIGAPAAVQHEVRWRDRSGVRVLARGGSADSTSISADIPAGDGVLELVGRGPLTWLDPRVVSRLRVARRALAFVLIGGALWLLARREGTGRHGSRGRAEAGRHDGSGVRHLFPAAAAAIGLVVAVTSLETGLRALGDRAPAPILAERHDLGEVRKDERWEHTARYGRRLRAGVDDTGEWRDGDIVRMGFVPAAVGGGALRRFSFQTDAEGFRNARVRERIDVAALGDSFTDAMTLDAAASWPSILERASGLAVQNYGTAGFGPQQELRALTDYALAHRPRIVVLAYFAGNDIFEAEAFDEYERSNGAVRKPDPGWPIKAVVSRADTWYVASALHAARRWMAKHGRAEASAAAPEDPAATARGPAPLFDRGMFTLPINGQTLRFAFMPPYLNTLRMPEGELSARHGWALTKESILQMRDASHAAGAKLVVMFLPFKSQVLLPIAVDTVARPELTRALRYALPDGSIDIEAMLRNRLAQNRMMRRFCEQEGIALLDTTDALAEQSRRGMSVYFPDDSHLNEAGQTVVAGALEAYLTRQRIPR